VTFKNFSVCYPQYLIFLTKIIWNNRQSQCLKDRYPRVIICNTDHNHNTFSCWGKIEHDLSNSVNIKSKPILVAGDTSMIVTNPDAIDFKNDVSTDLNTKIYGLNSIYHL
jgi:hypothetical protein